MADTLQADVNSVARLDVVPKILDVVCRMTGMGFAAVARVTKDRWIACAVRDDIAFGLTPGGELEVDSTICDEIRNSGQAVIIDDVSTDAQYCNHPTPARYGFQSYISVPINVRGEFFGTLCAIDPRPATLSGPQTRATFELFADLIGAHIEQQGQFDASQAALLDERATAELREQFIAVLGHDLRNPLASIMAGAQRLQKAPLDDPSRTIVTLMHQSAARMSTIIENVLDLARGRMGGGLQVNLADGADLRGDLTLIVDELRMAQPDRRIDTDFLLQHAVAYDRRRLGQLVSNLVANALTHGAADAPVRVRAATSDREFTLAVSNAGAPIPQQFAAKLFQPFSRGCASPDKQGLGLGLYIASEIARAHGGQLDFTSDTEATTFTLRIPRG